MAQSSARGGPRSFTKDPPTMGYDRRCFVVPPYLLRSIAQSPHNPDPIRKAAVASLTRQTSLTVFRHDRAKALHIGGGSAEDCRRRASKQSFVPEDILKHIVESDCVDEETRKRAQRDLAHLRNVHERVLAGQRDMVKHGPRAVANVKPPAPEKPFYRAVYDAENSYFESYLPGTMVRAEGEPKVEDQAVNDAYDNVGQVLKMFKDFFNWTSVDNENMPIVSTVHFGEQYENAYWDPDRLQIVFGDGNDFLRNFTGCVDVIGHELTHAVTENMTPLLYYGQSGALNEHISDVFGIMVKQRMEKEDAASADWLIGEGCIVPGVKGIALRSMKAPGTAYNDPRFGKDPQPDHFRSYEVTYEDNGGVHIYSGIPNRAFYLCAVAFGGYSWEKAGVIWWDTMRSGEISSHCTFFEFAQVTMAAAKKRYGEGGAKVVEKAWREVGVIPGEDEVEEVKKRSWIDRLRDMCRVL